MARSNWYGMLAAGAAPGASSGAAAGQAGQAGEDADFSSPQPGSEFSSEQPLEAVVAGVSCQGKCWLLWKAGNIRGLPPVLQQLQ